MSDEKITIEVDGCTLEARPGQMLIEVTDAAGIDVPRFCYHKKLSIAANCRMCLVDVEKAPKPLPACATPVTAGMIVRTRSNRALEAQKGTMEFLLINHPLDCPICDQGGECELQDVAMGYGRDVSRFVERKRVVADPDLGPLIATDMTRCIHCTRCVRFGEEIAGIRELGATGRGEHTRIGTYVEKTVDSELSGNVIDLCPVGALTAKPFRFQARAWEMLARNAIAAHDGVGSNLQLHVRRQRVLRVAPRDNEAINETWISDRDRYSYEGLASPDRLLMPQLRVDGRWREAGWDEALGFAAERLDAVRKSAGGPAIGALAHPIATVESLFLLQKLARGLGSNNVDHRLRQADFSADAQAPVFPWLGQTMAELEQCDAALVVGANLRKEQPLLAHRLRKTKLRGGWFGVVNPARYAVSHELDAEWIVAPQHMTGALASIARAVADATGTRPAAGIAGIVERADVDDSTRSIARALIEAERATLLLGALATAHPEYATLASLADFIAHQTDARFGQLPPGGNAAGAWIAGCVPHRVEAGVAVDGPAGLAARSMLDAGLEAYVLLHVEPDRDLLDPRAAMSALAAADCVVALTAFDSPALRAVASVMLPVGVWVETPGTWVNCAGQWQGEAAAINPPGEARPAWKVLRVLGERLGVEGVAFDRSEDVRNALVSATADLVPEVGLRGSVASETPPAAPMWRVGEVPIYAVDAVVRRAEALQATRDAVTSTSVGLSPADATRLGLDDGAHVEVHQGNALTVLPVRIDAALPEGAVAIPSGVAGSEMLGAQVGPVTIKAIRE
ncbi:MAG: NADH-quinone oxidoreductase subunit G [Chromatiales bacterium]|nr:NADH-quinone oxidoreductase subunit G [Chromatiales bacterium]